MNRASTNPPTKRIRTQAELAALAGVSQVSVHKALSGRTGVSEKLRERIRRIAQEHGYRVNASAKAMREKRFGSLALVLSSEPAWSVITAQLLAGINSALVARDLHLCLASLPDEKLTDAGYVPKILRQWMSDGLLINYTAHIPQRMIELIRQHQIPSIWINSKQPQNSVHPDDFDGAAIAARRLIELGHRRIVYLDTYHHGGEGPDIHYSVLDRWNGYRQTMEQASLEPRRLGGWRVWESGQLTAMLQECFSRPDRPTALITYGRREVYAAYVAACAVGLKVPRDVSLITFSGEVNRDLGLPLTTMLLPERAMGELAVQMLLQLIEDPALRLERQALKCTFSEGQTCAPAP